MANLVRYGLKNVHYAVFTEGASGAAGTYGTPKPLIGAVQMTTTPEGDSYTFYADDVAFYATETNAGYSGTLQLAAVNDDFLKDVLAYESDTTSGLTFEASDAVPKSVALIFEVSGNIEQQAGVFYNVTFSRMEGENNTKADTTEPDTVTLNFTAIGRNFTVGSKTRNVVRAHCSNSGDSHEAYDNFFTKVVCPGTDPAGA